MTANSQMRSPLLLIAAFSMLLLSGCATSFVRSDSTVTPDHVYPATAVDAEFFWETGIKGHPMIEMADPNYREGPGVRVMSCLGAVVDLPISLLFDTVFLPLDLSRIRTASKQKTNSDSSTSAAP